MNLISHSIRITLVAAVVLFAGCRGSISEEPPIHPNPNMDTQNKYKAQRTSAFFADGKAMRTPPEGTVARGQLREDVAFFTGKNPDGTYADLPFTVDEDILKRGADRFAIYCSPCHGIKGDGQGNIMKYKYPIPPTSFYAQKVYDMADGNIYEIITNGIRNMPSYRQQIPPADRWKIVAHVRALEAKGTPVPDTPPAGAAPAAGDTTQAAGTAAQSTETNTNETAQ